MPRLPSIAALAVALVVAGSPTVALAGPSSPSPAIKLGAGDEHAEHPTLLIVAGPNADKLDPIVDTLADALGDGGRPVSREVAPRVQDEPALARKRAAETGAQLVMILRLTKAPTDDEDGTFSITSYDSHGVRHGSVSPTLPHVLYDNPVPSPSAEPPTPPVPEAAPVPAPAPEPAPAPAPASDGVRMPAFDPKALETYQRERVRTHGKGLESFDFVRDSGDLSNADFYSAIGRDDLAARYRRRQFVRRGLFAANTALTVGGVVGGIALTLAGARTGFPNRKAAGLGLLIGALTFCPYAYIGIAAIRRHPVSEAEARGMVNEYNDALRRRLHVPRNVASSIHIGALASRNGGGLTLSGRF